GPGGPTAIPGDPADDPVTTVSRGPVIRTPDQRLRVFISSTIEELKAERLAAREAIESMRLSPVLFELGARPHAPRDLYRAYLEQSDVFVAIYAESYGWVAPDMTISGLEDEYRLSQGFPRLVYIREPSPERDPRLQALIDDIKASGSVSYRRFADAEELRRLLQDDLAVMLTERFVESQPPVAATPREDHAPTEASPVQRPRLPMPPTPLVGRVSELARARQVLLR